MKKTVTLLLSALLLCLGVAALAADVTYDPDDQSTWRTRPMVFEFTKTYVSERTDNTAAAVFPAETLTFTVAKAAGNNNPDDTMITVADARNTFTAGA